VVHGINLGKFHEKDYRIWDLGFRIWVFFISIILVIAELKDRLAECLLEGAALL